MQCSGLEPWLPSPPPIQGARSLLALLGRLQEDRPNLKLDLDVGAMTSEERSQAAVILSRAIKHLADHDERIEEES